MERSQLGLSTFIRPGWSLERWISYAQELGLGWVELRAEPGMVYAGDLSPAERAELRALLASTGLRFSLHSPIHNLELGSPNPRAAAVALAEIAASVELAADLGASPVVVHPGGLPREYAALPGSYEAAWRRLGFYLDVLVPHAAARGVSLALENKQRSSGRDLVLTPEEHLRALEGREGIGACLDFGHLNTLGGDPASYIGALGERLIHVHLHDNHGQVDEHLGLGKGTLPWRDVLKALAEHGYRGAVILEMPDPEDLKRSAELIEGEAG